MGRVGDAFDERPQRIDAPQGTDEQSGRWLRRHLAGPVVAVTTVHRDVFRATTVSACLIASISPLQILVSIEAESQFEGWLLQSRRFAVSILSRRDQFLADQFAGFAPLASGTFDRIPHFVASTGAPILTSAIGWMDCHVAADFETGDHRIFVGDVLNSGSGTGDRDEPLIYYANRYGRLA